MIRTSGIELREFCNTLLEARNETIADLCRETGLEKAMFTWWAKKPQLSPKVSTVYTIAKHLKLTVSELIGETDSHIPPDVYSISQKLAELPRADRDFIAKNVDFLCEKYKKNKADS